MNKVKYFFIIGFFLFSYGCEKSTIVSIPVPYEEDVVVESQLIAGQTFQGVRITRTVPVSENFDINKAEVKDAVVYLKVNDLQVIPLHFTSDGIYLPTVSMNIYWANKFELFGEVDGKSFYSQTTVPQMPVEVSSDYNSTGNYMEATVQSKPGVVYGGIWSIDRLTETSANDFYSIVSPKDNQTIISTRSTILPKEYQSSEYEGRRFIQVYAFDKQFEDFFNSKDNNQPVSNYFAQGGGSIAWNVYGDHIIGLFIGIAKSRY